MASFFKKLLLLSWKCQILRRRNWIITIFELIIPLAIFFLLSKLYYELSKMLTGAINNNQGTGVTDDASKFFFLLLKDMDIIYAPHNMFSDSIMSDVVEDIRSLAQVGINKIAKGREEGLTAWLQKMTTYAHESGNYEVGIVFSEVDSENNRFKYKIRTTDPNMITNKLVDEVDSTVVTSYVDTSMFLGIQTVLDRALLKYAGIQDNLHWSFGYLPSKSATLSMTTNLLYVFLIFAYLFFVVSVIKEVVDEKETGTKELMKIMGVDSWMIWVHWFVYTMMVQLLVIIGATVILTVWKPVVLNAGPLIVFLLLLLFSINFTFLLFVVSCLFYRTKGALTTCLIGWFVLNFIVLFSALKLEGNFLFLEILSSFYPVVNLCWALSSLWSFHVYGAKWTWNNLFTRGFTKFRIPVGVSIIMFIVSTIICIIILIYLDAIFPGIYGVPKPLTFVCQWFRDFFVSKNSYEDTNINLETTEHFEPVSKTVKAGIMLRGLHKKFGVTRKIVAVERVDLNIYQGEITALLGHNGAGKTTTMSMITGMTAPTSGVIMFEGQNITKNKKVFRESLGLCPQHNLYFSKLTVIEHLIFFGMLKGMTRSESKTSGNSLLYSLGMLEKANTRGSKLSGGMQRRLCLAVSLTGNPKVLILDEPTSGLDPQTRRLLWDVILGMRGQRTVLITTHSMEEAEVLGDRIAIMDHGRVVCSGTSIFLKKLFGTGYHVHVLKKPNASVEDISNVVLQNISQPQVSVISDIQVNYIIKEEFIENFPALFSALERQKESLNITGITVTCASMEDVFLKVAAVPMENVSKPTKDERPLSTALNINEFEILKGGELLCQRVKTLFEKRIIYRFRQIVSFVIKAIFMMLVMLFLILSLQIARKKYEAQIELLLNLHLYPDTIVLMAYDQDFKGIGEIGEKLVRSMSSKIKIFSNISKLEEYLHDESSDDNYNYIRKILFALTFRSGVATVRYHSSRHLHAPAIAINFLTNLLLLNNTNGSGIVQVVNHPFVNSNAMGTCDKEKYSILSLEIYFIYPCLFYFSLCFIILLGDVLWFITEERITGFKHQQNLAGVSPPVYWLINLTFDFCVYFVVVMILLLLFCIFGPKITFMHSTLFCLFVLVIVLLGLSGVAITYLYSFLFDNPGASLSVYIVFMTLLGMFPALVISTGVMSLLISFRKLLLVVFFLSFNPVFAATMSVRYILRAIFSEEACRVCKDNKCPTDLSKILRLPAEDDFSGILLYLIFLVFTSLFYPLILILIDCRIGKKIMLFITKKEADFSIPDDTDKDVKEEIARVKMFKYEDVETPLRVESLEKKYTCGPRAVDKVSFLVMKGDCFGLLGVNGAGKSTTFKMLTAEILPDKGDAYIYSCSVKTDRIDYMSSVGYCPQFDAIIPSLTGEEILSIMASLRGVPSFEVENAVTVWLDVMGIQEYGEKHCGTYSGGTKRKLSTAMSLIGSPEVVFMDEPTTGVDPASRRKLWTVIKEIQKQGQAVVLTTHSMEECEALCNRMTIMVAGQMKCIGSVEYLKTNFGQGFSVRLKLNEHTPEEVEQVKQDFDQAFFNNSIKDEHDILIHYTILDPKIPLSRLFADLLQFKNKHPIVADFTVANTTLEELFLSFATSTQRRLT